MMKKIRKFYFIRFLIILTFSLSGFSFVANACSDTRNVNEESSGTDIDEYDVGNCVEKSDSRRDLCQDVIFSFWNKGGSS